MALTKDQQSAVDVRDRTLLVSAAAGSGKTYTLTQRIIKAIIEDGQDLSRLLIVTFTRAAAGELKAKISKALGEAIAEHPENPTLQEQLIKLGNAHISTIDSFFIEPVRANFEKLGLPASMRLSDEAELLPIRNSIMQETLDSFFSRCEHYANRDLSPIGFSDCYTDLIGAISGARDSSDLIPTFWDIYKKLITSPVGIKQLEIHADRLKKNSEIDFFDTLEGNVMKKELKDTVRFAFKTLNKCLGDMQDDPVILSHYSQCFADNASDCASLLNTLENGCYGQIKSAFDAFTPKELSIPKADKSERSDYFKALYNEANDSICDIRKKYLVNSGDELSRLFASYSSVCSLIYSILSEFDKSYNGEKKRKGICEFSDMPRFMLALLLNEDGSPTEYARNLSLSFDEVYIDEYQDVNEIQDTIFAIIGESHRFMVGDIKQSIYGFREAEPSIFAQYRRRFSIYDKENDTPPTSSDGGNTIFMSENFRCDKNVIDFTNKVCSEIFSAFAEGIGYTQADDLKLGKKPPFPEYISPKVIINIIETPDKKKGEASDTASDTDDYDNSFLGGPDNLRDEAIVVANQIADMIRLEKNADGTPIKAGDIAILVRSHKHSKPIINALSALNIKYSLSSKGELFETEDMQILVNLLTVIDNPRSDIPLCHLLTTSSSSYSADLTLEETVTVRRFAGQSGSLYDALVLYSESGRDRELADKCGAFVALISKMRAAAVKMSADKLIKSLASSPRFADLASTEAYVYIYDSACKYVKNTWSGLYGFIKYFRDLMEHGELGSEPGSKKSDAVTVMSIHQSKGLEFNVCMLFGFGKQFNVSNKYPIIFNKDLGVSLKLPPKVSEETDSKFDRIRTRYENNPIYKLVDSYNRAKQLEEEARIFYVALTRARERLCISATLSETYLKFSSKIEACADTEFEIKKSNTYIKWILLSLFGRECDAYKMHLYEKKRVRLTEPMTSTEAVDTQIVADSHDTSLASLLSSSGTSELDPILATVPAKVAASKVSSHMLDDSIFNPIPTGKLFTEGDEDISSPSSDSIHIIKKRIELMRSAKTSFEGLLEVNKKPTAAEKGTATHAFLQFCNYESVLNNGLEYEIERLKNERFITERVADIINRKELDGFFKSSIFPFISSARHIHREFKFGMFRDAGDFTESSEISEIVKGKRIYVQGSIDLVVETDNGDILLCDYKTDRISQKERDDRSLLVANIKEKHGNQIEQYSYAIEKIFGRKPKVSFIYLLSLGEAIEIK